MNVYFIILCCICAISLGVSLVNHGKPREGDNNFFITLLSVAIQMFLIYKAVKFGF